VHFQEHWVKTNKAESKEKSEQVFPCQEAAALENVGAKKSRTKA